MRVLEGSFTNFGSYKSFSFDFSNMGLALAFGRTGSGKSSLPDMVAWTLFGVTAKDGSVDDVRSWTASGEPTIGILEVNVNDSKITITRQRGKSSQNDLYFVEYPNGPSIRGKDLNDTQKLLEDRLGVSADLYLTAAYFHEFSPTGTFFTAKAKDRRAVFEKIASMDLAVRLSEESSSRRKTVRKDLDNTNSRLSTLTGRQDSLVRSHRDAKERFGDFAETTAERIKGYETESVAFEKTKGQKIKTLQLKAERWQEEKVKKIDNLLTKCDRLDELIKPQNWGILDLEEDLTEAKKTRCSKCGGPTASEDVERLQGLLAKSLERKRDFEQAVNDRKLVLAELESVNESENPHEEMLKAAKTEVNNYSQMIEEEKKKVNPFVAQVKKLEVDLVKINCELGDAQEEAVTLSGLVSDLIQLYDLSFELRGELLKQAVQQAQDSTNRYLEKYFDSEIRVGFVLEGSDDLAVNIQKSGYDCVYKQLSKGQRGLLKLCFTVSIMKAAANKAGTHFDNLFFDEALDGLDSELKVKAFAMFEELAEEHESILLIDHALEFQTLFTKRFHVTMEADTSSVEELNE